MAVNIRGGIIGRRHVWFSYDEMILITIGNCSSACVEAIQPYSLYTIIVE